MSATCTNLMSQVIRTKNLAMALVYQARLKDSPQSDIWACHQSWPQIRAQLQDDLLRGTYLLSPVQSYMTENGIITRWSSRDSIVFKAISLVLQPALADMMPAYHLKKGMAGLKAPCAMFTRISKVIRMLPALM
jgi:hypothetical protein